MTNKREGKQRMGTVFKSYLWSHSDWCLALNILGNFPPMNVYLVCPLPLFWIARFKGWHSLRLTSPVRQMELRGARQRPDRPCQLIWPQAQPDSITTTAVNIQLKLVWILFTVSFSRLQKMTVVLETPCSTQAGWYTCQSQLCMVGQVSLGTEAGWCCLPSQRLLHCRDSQGKCLEQLSPFWLPGWSDWLGGCSLLLHSSQSCPVHKHHLPRERRMLFVPCPRFIFYSASRSDLKCNLTMSLTGLTLQQLSLAWC